VVSAGIASLLSALSSACSVWQLFGGRSRRQIDRDLAFAEAKLVLGDRLQLRDRGRISRKPVPTPSVRRCSLITTRVTRHAAPARASA